MSNMVIWKFEICQKLKMFLKLTLFLLININIFSFSDKLLNDNDLSKKELFFSIEKALENKNKCYRLCLGGQSIVELNEDINQLSLLQDLNISQNEISTLPEKFGNLLNLTELNLSGNKIVRFPTSMTNLKNLKSLNISSMENPDWENIFLIIQNLTSLEVLDISYNQLPFHLFDRLPKSIKKIYITECNLNDEQVDILRKKFENIEILK